MKGIYLNSDISELPVLKKFFKQYNAMLSLELENSNSLTVCYSPLEWGTPPVYRYTDGSIFVVSGWFVFDDKKNDIARLAESYRTNPAGTLASIRLGNFIGLFFSAGVIEIFNDPLGLSSHFYSYQSGKYLVAPSIHYFSGHTKDDVQTNFYESAGHLYGTKTIYKEVLRFEPGSINRQGCISRYYHCPFDKRIELWEVPKRVKEIVQLWPEKRRCLAISAGLDSRLILTAGKFNFGYTYGPKDSGDRVVARKFSKLFGSYHEFDYDAPPKVKNEEQLCAHMFHGSGSFVYRLLSAYRYARENAGDADVFFDGYLGDVLQRGEYIKFPGILGEIFRLFPILYNIPLKARFILRRRYKGLSEELFEDLYSDFLNRTEGLNITSYQKVTFYEFLYGRGARLTINGGVLTAGQFFTLVPVFCDLDIFETLISYNQKEAIQFRLLRQIWKKVDKKFTEIRTETGFKPLWRPWRIAIVHFFWRLVINFFPSCGNYAVQLKRAEKENR